MSTIRDVARESGVSVATVSYVLNNGPRPVKPQTRERVLAVMRQLDYHPNAMARGLVRRQLHTVGVLFGQIESTIVTNPYAATLLQGILAAAADLDYNVTIFPKEWRGAARSIAPLRDRRTDGFLIIAPLMDSDLVPAAAALKLPAVTISAISSPHGIPYVDVDNYRGGVLATEHLLTLGHRRIAHVHGKENHSSVRERRAGYRETLEKAGISPLEEYILQADYSGSGADEATRRLFQLPEPPTAIFAGNDMLALRVLETARQIGVRVPEQLSVVGFDDIAPALMVQPALTTVRQPLVEIGKSATQHLVKIIEDRQRQATTKTIEGESKAGIPVWCIEPTLIVRGTTAPPGTLRP
jgi:DNA-binding LacI/PurR family transcriptional regulator